MGAFGTFTGLGQAGEDIAKAGQQSYETGLATQDIRNKWMMDYLAAQARNRQLGLEETGQQQALKIAQGQQDIERQRLQQSRWTPIGSPTQIPDPSNPGGNLYRHTFGDPITGETRNFDTTEPPPGSIWAIKKNFLAIKNDPEFKNLPLSDQLTIAGSKLDTKNDVERVYSNLWDMGMADPAEKERLLKQYPGGKFQYVEKGVKDKLLTPADVYWKNIMDGRTNQGQNRVDQDTKLHLQALSTELKGYLETAKTASDSIKALSLGKNSPQYDALATQRDMAAGRAELIQSQINDIAAGRPAGGAGGGANQPSSTVPTGGEPTATGPNGHKIVFRGGQWVDAGTGQPIAAQ